MSLIKTKYETTKIYDAPACGEVTCVQDIFPIEAIDESGIFALPGGKYSKTYMLSDINFAGVTDEEQKALPERLEIMKELIPSFCLQGIDRTMNQFNHK